MTNTNPSASATDCNEQPLLFPELTSRPLTVDFAAGHVSSDGGGVLLARLDRSFGYLQRFAAGFTDHRDPELIEHTVLELLRQRVYGLALGYEDLNDHDRLCVDPLLASLCGKKDPLGQDRLRKKDQGKPLAGKSTLNRLELTPAGADARARYKKIVGDPARLEDFFIAEYVRSLAQDTTAVTLDLDATDDPLHGDQEGKFFHAYYGGYSYLPLYIFAGNWPVVAWLRTSDRDASDGALEKIKKIVAALRQRFPQLKIRLRGDSGFCRDALLVWCELNAVKYIFGLARNPVLERKLKGGLEKARQLSEANEGQPARVFVEMTYGAKSWHTRRWVIGKAEWTQGAANPRFIITNENPLEFSAPELYEKDYCGRGDMENRIKEQPLDLYADRISTATLRANQLRLWFSTLAYLLMNQLREVGLKGTELARATCGTIHTRLLKIGALVRVSVRR
ncbi:MAG: IS1380 family transposase, partial [Candidatus Micrarchaeota archaeon]|nr:IS1380 family transposase [Candidatus Micrarchaeota archaeon]